MEFFKLMRNFAGRELFCGLAGALGIFLTQRDFRTLRERNAVKIAVSLFFILLPFSILSAQKEDRKVFLIGSVANSVTYEPVFGAKVEVLNAGDSSLVSEGESGKFQMNGLTYKKMAYVRLALTKPGKFLVRCTAEGYDTTYNELNIPKFYKHETEIESFQKPFLIKKTRLQTEETYLETAVVKATQIKFYNKGDTLVYNADAFELAEGSMLDRLIKQLPGMEVKRGGEIYVNGRKVDELLLDGKSFFSDDRQLMLDNLPAFMVKDVKAYEQQDPFRPYAIGPDSKKYVLDVGLKRQYQTGWIANAEAGGGTDERFLGRLFALRFTPHSRLSFFGNANNLSDDRAPGDNGDWSPLQQATGVMKSYTGGFNYDVSQREGKYNLKGDARLSYTEGDYQSQGNSVNFLEGGDTYGRSASTSASDRFSVSTNHSLSFLPTPKTIFFIQPKFSYSKDDRRASSADATFSEDVAGRWGKDWLDSIMAPNAGGLLRQYSLNRTLEESLGEGHDLNASLLAGTSFGLPHNSLWQFQLYGLASLDDSKRRDYTHYRLEYPVSAAATDFRNRYDYRKDRDWNYESEATAYLSIRKSEEQTHQLRLRLAYFGSHRTGNRSLYRLDGSDGWGEGTEHELGTLPSVNELSRLIDRPNSYESEYNSNGGWLTWQYLFWIKLGEGKYVEGEISLPLEFERDELSYNRNSLDTLFHRNLWRFRPEIRLNTHNINFTYTYTPTAPSMTYLVNYRDDSDPLNIVQGARELKSEQAHDLNLSYRRTLKKQSMYNVGTNFNIRKNSLAMGYTYDRTTGVRTITPQTVDGNWHLRFWGGYSTPLDSARRWNLQFNGRAAYYNSVDLIDQRRSEVCSYYLTPTLKIDYRPSSRLYLALKADVYYQHSVSEREDFETINLCDFDYGLTAQVELPFDLQLATDLTMYSRRGYADGGMDSDELVWNARLSKRFLKGNLVLMLDGFDLLGNLSNVRRSINAQGRVETWHNVTPRYAMFHAVYRFNKQPKNK